MLKAVEASLQESLKVKAQFINSAPQIVQAAQLMVQCLKNGGKLLICGNGGSAADSQHIAAELMGRFQSERPALAAIALSVDSSFLTAWANDYDYDSVFERQVSGLGKLGDVLLCISTSGNSKNVLKAAKKAKELGLKTIALSGKDGGTLREHCDVSIVAPSDKTARIQECHIAAYHCICEIIDREFS
ncbi:MAG: phosphoheptose isomerase [Deltaproteobacteria bacterium CG11_big_fil_rev_8_21_14_0_20_45_16]|nr:MAG: phosphoheptose isomerase [Deltaproteobacteria bacterium CG11_big_fil_rev_8_21_14_0_20_45_16]